MRFSTRHFSLDRPILPMNSLVYELPPGGGNPIKHWLINSLYKRQRVVRRLMENPEKDLKQGLRQYAVIFIFWTLIWAVVLHGHSDNPWPLSTLLLVCAAVDTAFLLLLRISLPWVFKLSWWFVEQDWETLMDVKPWEVTF